MGAVKFNIFESMLASLTVIWWMFFNRAAFDYLNYLCTRGVPLAEGFLIIISQL